MTTTWNMQETLSGVTAGLKAPENKSQNHSYFIFILPVSSSGDDDSNNPQTKYGQYRCQDNNISGLKNVGKLFEYEIKVDWIRSHKKVPAKR